MPSDRMFPLLSIGRPKGAPAVVPWSLVEPGRAQAERNHSQSLETLARRGGLSVQELRAAVVGYDLFSPEWYDAPESEALAWLLGLLAAVAPPDEEREPPARRDEESE